MIGRKFNKKSISPFWYHHMYLLMFVDTKKNFKNSVLGSYFQDRLQICCSITVIIFSNFYLIITCYTSFEIINSKFSEICGTKMAKMMLRINLYENLAYNFIMILFFSIFLKTVII